MGGAAGKGNCRFPGRAEMHLRPEVMYALVWGARPAWGRSGDRPGKGECSAGPVAREREGPRVGPSVPRSPGADTERWKAPQKSDQEAPPQRTDHLVVGFILSPLDGCWKMGIWNESVNR